MLTTDTLIYMLDVSIDKLMGDPRLVWIDHHKSAMGKLGEDIYGYRIDGVAACRLAWQWFTTDRSKSVLPIKSQYVDRTLPEPLSVRLAGEYDIWDKRDTRAELFQHGLKSRDISENLWELLLVSQDDDGRGKVDVGTIAVEALLESGKVIQFVREKEYASVITEQGFDIQFEGLTFLACCSHELDIRSHLFAAGVNSYHDALLGFTYSPNAAGLNWRVSMYHAPGHESHDLSQIAVKYGGGGHRGACGFRAKSLPFLT